MRKKSKNHRAVIKRIAKSRMIYLFQKAQEIFPQNHDLSNRYIYLARRYSQRAKIEIPLRYFIKIKKEKEKKEDHNLN